MDRRPPVTVGLRRALDRHVPISQNAAAGVQSSCRELLDSAERFLSQPLKIQAVAIDGFDAINKAI
jgi:hypothetical protein